MRFVPMMGCGIDVVCPAPQVGADEPAFSVVRPASSPPLAAAGQLAAEELSSRHSPLAATAASGSAEHLAEEDQQTQPSDGTAPASFGGAGLRREGDSESAAERRCCGVGVGRRSRAA